MGRREFNKQVKREALVAAGLTTFLQHGYERASIEQIAALAGVARGTFYLYFEDKLALFEALVDSWFIEMFEQMEHMGQTVISVEGPEALWGAYGAMASHIAEIGLTHPQAVLLTIRESRMPGPAGELIRRREQRMVDAAVSFTEAAVAGGLVKIDHPRVAVLVILGACERLFFEVVSGNDLGDTDLVSQAVFDLFEQAMRPTWTPPSP